MAGLGRRLLDDLTGRNPPQTSTRDKDTSGSTVPGGNARGTVYDEDGTLRIVPINEVLDEEGRWR